MKLTETYEAGEYNLNSQNCTDFGIDVAKLVGVDLPDKQGEIQVAFYFKFR